MKRKLIIKKSFSKVDKSYIQLFKFRKKLSANAGDYKTKEIIMEENDKQKLNEDYKNTDSTSAKLDMIISNLRKSNSYITRQFLEDITFQNENDDLRQRMQVLYKRRKLKEKNDSSEKIKEQEHINSTQEAIQHMLYFAKKYAMDKETVRIKTEQNNKKPPICRYTPSLDYISKHIPVVHLGNHKTIINEKENRNIRTKINDKNKNEDIININNNSIIIINEKNNKNNLFRNYIHNNYNNNKLMITENSNSKSNINTSKSFFHSNNKSINNSAWKERYKIKILKNILKNSDELKLNKENEKIKFQSILEPFKLNNNLTAGKYTLKVQRHSLLKKYIPRNMKLNQNKMRYNISVPLFNKMTSREKVYPLVDKNKNMADYYPNYDAILPSNYKFNGINEKMKKKKYKLRKILGSYNPNEEYVLLPILNK